MRVLGIGKALREAGYRVMFAGMEKRGRVEDRLPDGGYCYQGFTYVPGKDQGQGQLARMKRALLTCTGLTTFKRIRNMDVTDIHAIVAYQPPASLLWRLLPFCRRHGIILAADCTEWYDPRHVWGGPLGPFRWDSELRMRWLQPRTGRVIAISSLLESYYRQRGCKVLRVPPLVDMDVCTPPPESPQRDDGILRLVYAGTPGKKDLLGNAIRGLHNASKQGLPVELHLVGPERQSVAACLAGDAHLLDDLGTSIVYHGRVPQPVALGLVARADFSILLRPDQRYANAGFPTKLVESLSMGVPILTNPTSDIADYVRDRQEGLLLQDSSPEAFAAGVRRVLEMPRSQWMAMRVMARQRAFDCFDYHHYIEQFRDFLK